MGAPDVVSAIESLAERGEPMALATVVAVRGSAYRRPGARLVLPRDSPPTGSVSPGCLEADLVDVAAGVMQSARPALRTFDLTGDDETELGYGLGCRGILDVFVEPGPAAVVLATEFRAVATERRPRAVVTVLDGEAAGLRLSLEADGTVHRSIGQPFHESAVEAAREAFVSERSAVRELAPGARAFVEVVRPPIRLVVCGERSDAPPLANAASALGWEAVRVTKDAVPPPELLDARTYAVLMNHAYEADREHLRTLLASPVAYIAMLGPRDRSERLLAELRVEGGVRARIFAPAGLDIGAEGPDEIAQSIVAEILAVDRGRPGSSLRDRNAPIHAGESVPARE